MRDKERRMLEKKLIQEVLKGKVSKREASQAINVTKRSLDRYLRRFWEKGPESLYDGRQSNYWKIDERLEGRIVECKLQGLHRSARLIRDLLGLAVHEETVRRVSIKYQLERVALPPVKPIRRFVAEKPSPKIVEILKSETIEMRSDR
jgi:transposase